MNVLAIIQARMGSSRLPGKVLLKINKKTLLEILIERIRRSKYINKICVATTMRIEDSVLYSHVSSLGVECFRGSENDVLSRFYFCAKNNDPHLIVRITADDPLKDPDVIDSIILEMINDESLDYCSNTLVPTFPEGLDVEVFKFKALEIAFQEALLESEREHVTPYIWKNNQKFNLKNIFCNYKFPNCRLTVDYYEDYLFIKKMIEMFDNSMLINCQDIANILISNPKILSLSSNIPRNEGYLRSLNREKECKNDNK
jgi:spore coat polysaccharide biosynthesis protein SpsF (cytidylyltransferase family)